MPIWFLVRPRLPCGSEPAREDNRTVDEDVNALASSRAGSLPQDLRQTCIGLLLEIRCGSELARDSSGSAK